MASDSEFLETVRIDGGFPLSTAQIELPLLVTMASTGAPSAIYELTDQAFALDYSLNTQAMLDAGLLSSAAARELDGLPPMPSITVAGRTTTDVIDALQDQLKLAYELIATLSQRSLAMSGDVPSTEEVRTDRNPEPANPVKEHVDAVIDDLTGRKVAARDRARLGDALRDAGEAQRGREGADTAIGNAIGKRPSQMIGLRTAP